MSLTVTTINPAALLANIKKAIIDKEIKTWGMVIGDKIEYFTHTADQWDKKALFSSSIGDNKLTFTLTWYKDKEPNLFTKGIYHGRFLEMLCNHFGSNFTSINTVIP